MSTLRTSEIDDILVVEFTESNILDESKVQQIGNDLLETVIKARGGKLLMNLAGISFMSSAMITEFIRLKKKCDAADKKLKLCSLSEKVAEAFKIMQLQKLFDIHQDEKKAVGAFNKKKGWFG